MKKIIIAACVLTMAISSRAQKIAIVDSRLILDKMPAYKTAQKTVDENAMAWQKEIDTRQDALNKMYDNYDSESATLSESAKRKKEQELYLKEKELRDLQKKRFGFEGDLFKKRQELVKPIQDKINEAVQRLGSSAGYDLILDKSEGNNIIFADPKLDKTQEVLNTLGVK